MLASLGILSLIGLAWYGATIPLCYISIKKLKEIDSRNDITSLAVADLILVSFIGGILILTIKDDDFKLIDKEEAKEKKENSFLKIKKSLKSNREPKEKKKTSKKDDYRFDCCAFIGFGVLLLTGAVILVVIGATKNEIGFWVPGIFIFVADVTCLIASYYCYTKFKK